MAYTTVLPFGIYDNLSQCVGGSKEKTGLYGSYYPTDKLCIPHVIIVTWAQGICLICMPEGIHIRQITRAHVTSNMYHFRRLLVRGRALSSL